MTTSPYATEPRPAAAGASVAAGFWPRLRRFAHRHRRFAAGLAVVLSLLAVVSVSRSYGPAGAGLIAGPAIAAALVAFGRRWGLSWSELGLSRRAWAKGGAVAAVAVAAVAVVYVVAAALPATRAAFLDTRYQLPTGQALITALVLIPLGTVLVEEIAFRGVLQGLVTRHRGAGWGLGLPSALFGAWHILPSLGLNRVNPAVAGLAGNGTSAQVLAVLGAVAFTAVAGLLLGEVRRRRRSVLAPIGLHWAVNGMGVLVATVLPAASTL